MKLLGESVILAFADGLGAGASIASALQADNLTQSVQQVSLSLESYGKPDQVPLEVVNYSNEQGKALVSLVIVKQETPSGLHSCVAHEVLQYIARNAPVEDAFSIFIPAAVPSPSYSPDARLVYKMTFNDCLGTREQMFSELTYPPETLQIRDEFLASLMHLVRVMGFPAVFLLIPVHRVNPLDKHEIAQEKASAFQAISILGELLAQWLALGFSVKNMAKDLPEKFITKSSTGGEWSGLYS